MFIFERERERQSIGGVGAEREGDTESESSQTLNQPKHQGALAISKLMLIGLLGNAKC